MTEPLTVRTLRLTDDDDARADRARREIADANRRAAALDPAEAFGLFAARVAESLDGGRAAVLTPAKRRRLIALAQRLGIRPFDANLTIAAVQDGRRRGEAAAAVSSAAALAPSRRAPGPGGASVLGPILAACAAALGAVLALIAWLTGG